MQAQNLFGSRLILAMKRAPLRHSHHAGTEYPGASKLLGEEPRQSPSKRPEPTPQDMIRLKLKPELAFAV